MKNSNKIILLSGIACIFYSILMIREKTWKEKLNRKFVYLLGKVSKIESSGDGINFCFNYYYGGKQYNNCLATLNIKHQDSIILLKVSKEDPSLVLKTEIELPNCVILSPNFLKLWDSIPSCSKNQ